MDRLIFLDIDGVLRTIHPSVPTLRATDGRIWRYSYNPLCVGALNTITEATGARLVLSSTWRDGGIRMMRQILSRWGVRAQLISLTPGVRRYHSGPRGWEVACWLTLHRRRRGACRYIILDDDEDFAAPLRTQLLRTDYHEGLTMGQATQAIRILCQR